MSVTIHPSAVVHPSAVLADGVEVGPFAVVGENVTIGARTKLLPHCHVVKRTTIGEDCTICTSAVVGGDPQDLKFHGEDTDLFIGNHTHIGEFATINRGTAIGGGKTQIGSECMIMAYVHIAHDCIVGDRTVITNLTQLAGHIHIEDNSWISGLCLIHHFVTVGSMSFLAPSSGVAFDIPPYMIVEGFRDACRVRTLNIEGLKRRHVPEESIHALRRAFKTIYRQNLTQMEAIAEIEATDLIQDSYVRNLVNHLKASNAGVQNRALERFRTDRVHSGDTKVMSKPQ